MKLSHQWFSRLAIIQDNRLLSTLLLNTQAQYQAKVEFVIEYFKTVFLETPLNANYFHLEGYI